MPTVRSAAVSGDERGNFKRMDVAMSCCPHSRRVPEGRVRFRLALAALLTLASAACADTGTGTVDRTDEQLLFVSTSGDERALDWRNLNKDIYRMNADGTGVENLTRHPSSVYASLSLSPDGRKVAFNSDRSGCYAIWAMDTHGTNLVQLTGLRSFTEERCNYAPRWSPDGTRIAFTTTREQSWAIYVMNADGSSPHNVSSPVDEGEVYTYPTSWSPEGRVVFNAHFIADGSSRAYTVNRDGTGLTPLFGRAGDYFPHWSPDGSRIAFISDRDGSPRLYVMNSDGTGVRRLSNLSGEDVLPHAVAIWRNEVSPWSPDGSQIAFENLEGATVSLHVVNVDGSGMRRLAGPETYSAPLLAMFNGWSPSGDHIAFTSSAAGSYDIYVIEPDGTGRVNLTNSPAHETDALWLPSR